MQATGEGPDIAPVPEQRWLQISPDRRAIYYLCLIGFFAIFSTTLSKNPVLPLFSHALGADDAMIGLISAFSPLAGILFSFPVGVLSDHFGRKRLLVASGMVFFIAPLLYLLIANPVFLIPVRFFHGTATAILGPVISAVIAERFPAAKGEVLGQYSSSTLVGRTIAPLTGGTILAVFAGYHGLVPYQIIYILAAAASLPVFILLFFYQEGEEKPLAVIPFPVFRDSFARFLASPRLRAAALADMAIYFAFGALETFLPLLLMSQGIGVFLTGILFAAQVVVIAGTKPFFGKLADRFDKRVQIIAGLLIISLSLAAIAGVTNFSGYLSAAILFGLGMSLSSVATSAYIADVAEPGQIGASMGALSSIMDIGQTMGPVVTGILIATAGYTSGFLASFLLVVVVTVVFAVSARDNCGG